MMGFENEEQILACAKYESSALLQVVLTKFTRPYLAMIRQFAAWLSERFDHINGSEILLKCVLASRNACYLALPDIPASNRTFQV